MSDLFTGTWELDIPGSKVWEDAAGRYVPDDVGSEIITISTTGDVQDYEVLYGDKPTIRMGYTASFDSADWVPYSVRSVTGVPEDELEESVEHFKQRINAAGSGNRRRNFTVGANYGLVRIIWVNDRSHYRLSKNEDDDSVQAMMLRKLADDGQSYLASVMDANGVLFRVRRFVRA